MRRFLTTLITLTVLAGIVNAQSGTIGTYSFSRQTFDQALTNGLAGKVMGYQYVLIKKGQFITEGAGGLAQNTADGQLAMTTSTPSNMGSLAKFLSGTAMLHLMKHPAGTYSTDYGVPLERKLSRPFLPLTPDVWSVGATPGVETITFRQLLQHRSGFDDAKANNRNVIGFLQDPDGFNPAQYDIREYSNINFVLNGYLMQMYQYPFMKSLYNSHIQQFGMSQEEGGAYVEKNAGDWMHNYMKTEIWDKMSPKISPNCDAKNTLQDSAAYGYSSVNDQTKGALSSAIESEGHCVGHGGYYLSARGLAEYVAYYAASNLIVDDETRNLMINDTMDPDDRLVWSFTKDVNYFKTHFNMPTTIWSNGVAGGYRTVLIRLPDNYYLVIMTNSPDLSAGALFAAGASAFIQAVD